MTDRAQTFTLEALIGAIILLAAVAFALQAVSISSNTASIADAELRGQQAGLAESVLERNAENGNLTAAVLYWNESDRRFYDSDGNEDYYISPSENTTFGNDTSFGRSLESVLDGAQIRYNVNLHYRGDDGGRETQRLVESGTPSTEAVRIVETVTLTNGTMLVDREEKPRTDATLGAVDGFYAPDADPERDLYNVIRVEVVLWQI